MSTFFKPRARSFRMNLLHPLTPGGNAKVSITRAVLLEVQDISDFVREEKKNAKAPYDRLVTPREDVYPIAGRKGVSRTE
jgi:hypothetical protein